MRKLKKSNPIVLTLAWLALSTLSPQLSTAFAQGTAFTYQGRLNANGGPANGIYDFQFTVYDALSSGNAVGGPLTASAVPVTSGLFTVALDFGAVFDGNARWLDISVKTNGASSYTTLAPRQPLTPTPYALYSMNADLAVNATKASSVGPNAVTSAQRFFTLRASIQQAVISCLCSIG